MKKHFGIYAGISLALGPFLTSNGMAEEPRLSGIEAFTVEYALEGMQEGKVVQHVKNWGRNSVEFVDASTTMMGFTTATNHKVVVDGASITTIDYSTNSASKINNPYYEPITKGLEGKDPSEAGKAILEAMGGQPTGESRTFAGESCSMWNLASLSQEICITNDGLTLFMNISMMGVSMTRTATSVDRGNPGPASAYEVPDNIPVTEVPF